MGCGGSKVKKEFLSNPITEDGDHPRSILALGTAKTRTEVESKFAHQIAYYSNHGWEQKRVGVFQRAKGPALPKVNQDRVFVTSKLCGQEGCWLFSVFDGNGPQGDLVSHAAGKALVKYLEAESKPIDYGVHEGFSCDVSGMVPIRGIRYHKNGSDMVRVPPIAPPQPP
jgi:hypothetical protein